MKARSFVEVRLPGATVETRLPDAAALTGRIVMNREDLVTVKSADGGAIAFAAGQKYALKIAAGATADKWEDGSPITRSEFETVLAPHGPFEIADEKSAS